MPEVGGVNPRPSLPFALQTGVASTLRLSFVKAAGVMHFPFYGGGRLSRDGNGMTMWEAAFFRLPVSDTLARGGWPLQSLLVTPELPRKAVTYASRDYALRKVMDDWFFGASSTFGRPVERARTLQDSAAGTGGILGWGHRSVWTTVASLIPNHRFGNDDTTIKTKMEGWFFGKTEGSPDVHVLYTLGYYPWDG